MGRSEKKARWCLSELLEEPQGQGLRISVVASLGLVTLIEDVVFPLMFVGQRRRGFHSVKKNNAVEMIEFVLKNASMKAISRQRHRCAFEISGPNLDPVEPWNKAPETGDREAALPSGFDTIPDRLDLGIDEQLWGNIRKVIIARQPVDKKTEFFGNLRRRKADATLREHRSNHVSGQSLQPVRPKKLLGNRLGHLSEHRVAEPDDLKQGGFFKAVSHRLAAAGAATGG